MRDVYIVVLRLIKAVENKFLLLHCCNPAKTLYSKIMYKYAQFIEMKTIPCFRDYNKVNCADF